VEDSKHHPELPTFSLTFHAAEAPAYTGCDNFALRQTHHTISPTMDFNSLRDTVSNLSLYDLKASVRKVQNGSSSFFPTGNAITC